MATLAKIVIAVVVALNCAGVFYASVFAVGGDGSAAGVYTVWIVGLTWVSALAYAAARFAGRGNGAAGVIVALFTLPSGFILAVLAMHGWRTFWFYWPDAPEFKAACAAAHTRYPARPAAPVRSIAFESLSAKVPSVVYNSIEIESGTRVISLATENPPFPATIKFTEFKRHAPRNGQPSERYYRSVGNYGTPEEIAGYTADVLVSYRYHGSDVDFDKASSKQGVVGYELTVVDRRDGRTLGTMRYFTHLAENRACGEAENGLLSTRRFILKAAGVK